MKRAEQNSKLEVGLRAYADSVEAGGALTSFRQRLGSWPVYAMAAGSALALSTSAMANIISSGPIFTTSVDIDGNTFAVGVDSSVGEMTGHGTAILNGHGIDTVGGDVKAFGSGAAAFGATKFSGSGNKLLAFASFSGAVVRDHKGQWPSNGTAYAAIKLNNGDLGWLKIDLISPNPYGVPGPISILGWAYDETGAPPPAVPEPNGLALALLATGSVGVLAYRRWRKALAAQPADPVQ